MTVKVKPLVWDECGVSGEYHAYETASGKWRWYLRDVGFLTEIHLTEDAAKAAAQADYEARVLAAIEAPVQEPVTPWDRLIADAICEAQTAMRKFPQPNYVISKVAEEAGEVVKAAIHAAEGRETAENLRGEMKQLIAMLYRLWIEGDQVHGLPPVSPSDTDTTPQPDETAALRAKLAEVERELKCVVAERNRAQKACETIAADRDEERKLADDAVVSLAEVVARCGPLAEDGKRAKAVIARHAARRKEQQG